MEIARLEVLTQHHLDRMQETAKVNYVQYGKSTKHKKGKKSTQSGASGGNHKGDRGHGTSSKPSGKGKKLPFPQDTCYRCGNNRHQKTQDCKALDAVCLCAEVVERRDTLRKFVSNLNIPHIHLRFHKLPPVLQGQGPVDPSTLMMMNSQYLHIWSVFLMQTNI